MATVLAGPEQKSALTPTELELTLLREEMELIAYVTSHDLLAPLRIMNYACETLKEKRGEADSEKQEALQTIGAEILHSKALLEGLLEYIRLQTFTFAHVVLDANELVLSAVDSLQEEIRSADVTVTYGALPKVWGHRGRLIRLFAYLIDNAIKFRGAQAPKIYISAERTGNFWTFCVEDNGMGIDPEMHETIFRLFQRLHTAEAYPGYGIGLALSQKIVAAQGGKLWVESGMGKGSRFFFTLPAVE